MEVTIDNARLYGTGSILEDVQTTASDTAGGTAPILDNPSVKVSTSLDVLLEKLLLETTRTQEEQKMSRLQAAIASLVAQGTRDAERLEKAGQLLEELDALQKELETAQSELAKAESALAKAQTGTDKDAIAKAEAQKTACQQKVDGLNAQIKAKTEEVAQVTSEMQTATLQQLAAAVSVSKDDLSGLEKILKELITEQADERLASLDMFLKLLDGENFNDVMLEKLGIPA